MFRILCLSLCVYVSLVTANNQNPQLTCPYSRQNYGTNYGGAPVFMQQPTSYTPQLIIQNVPNYQPRNSITDLQQIYLNKLLTNPTIQAFIDPSTKIYNQHGVDISNQILPRTPNVVNNYFIVPNDYFKENAKGKMRMNDKHAAYITNVPKARKVERKPFTEITKSAINVEKEESRNKELKSNTKHSKKKKKSSTSIKEQLEISGNVQKTEKKKNNVLIDGDLMFDEIHVDKAKTNFKRQDVTKDTSINVVHEKATDLEQKRRLVELKNEQAKEILKESKGRSTMTSESNKSKSTSTSDRESSDVKKQSNNKDNRNVRNPVTQNNEHNKPSPKHQDNFMKQWMEYIKAFTPMQNFDSYDFKNLNLPYNFDQMYQFPKASNTASDISTTPKNRRRKQQRKNKQQTENNSNKNTKSEVKSTTIEVESKPIFTEIIEEKIESDAPITKSLEATHYLIDSTENSLPIVYDFIDYYPDFTKDKLYISNENDQESFHNRYFYETKEDLNYLEGSKYEGKRDSTKQIEKSKRGNTIPSSDIDFKDHRKPVFEDLKFQTPPTLIDPGFETKKVNSRDINNNESRANHERLNQTKRKNVETVFARSKVVKYGQQEEVLEKPRVIEEHHKNGERKHNPKDGDTIVVFAQSSK